LPTPAGWAHSFPYARRSKDTHAESWQIFYGDVRVGTIGIRVGVPVGVDQWGWSLRILAIFVGGVRRYLLTISTEPHLPSLPQSSNALRAARHVLRSFEGFLSRS